MHILEVLFVTLELISAYLFNLIRLNKQKHSLLDPVPTLKDAWHEWLGFSKFDLFQLSNTALSATCSSCLCFFSGKGSKHGLGDGGTSYLETPKNSSSNKRRWTNILLAINVV